MEDRREIKTARDVRVVIAEHDIPVGRFAELAGIHVTTLSTIMHGQHRMTRFIRVRIEKAAEALDANPPVEVPEELPRSERFPRVRKL